MPPRLPTGLCCLRTVCRPPPSTLVLVLRDFKISASLPPCPTYPSRRIFSSAASSIQSQRNNQAQNNEPTPTEQQLGKKRSTRAKTSKNSLRRVAAASEAAQHGGNPQESGAIQAKKICTAYCTAEKYDLPLAADILRGKGYTLDPFATGLLEQVLHIRLPIALGEGTTDGDVFIFPSGNIVSWSLPSPQISSLATTILPAAETPYLEEVETEDLEYIEDSRVRRSRVGGDVIIVGTASSTNFVLNENDHSRSGISPMLHGPDSESADELNITLAKIAFSSGLARSTKLAVLESLLHEYLVNTSNIPVLLSRGSRLPFTRSFILRKTGELLQFRAQLNLYSELTDSLPDIFWDSRHELGLEGYYESIGRALDVNVRIRQLNEKLDYASGIVEVLRERLSEKHSLGLEWMIIILITVEVGFEVLRLWKEGRSEEREDREYRTWKQKKEREQDQEFQAWKMETAGKSVEGI